MLLIVALVVVVFLTISLMLIKTDNAPEAPIGFVDTVLYGVAYPGWVLIALPPVLIMLLYRLFRRQPA